MSAKKRQATRPAIADDPNEVGRRPSISGERCQEYKDTRRRRLRPVGTCSQSWKRSPRQCSKAATTGAGALAYTPQPIRLIARSARSLMEQGTGNGPPRNLRRSPDPLSRGTLRPSTCHRKPPRENSVQSEPCFVSGGTSVRNKSSRLMNAGVCGG